jgi:hypothetical protein
MTNMQKASQVLKYMEDELDQHTIIQLLNPYLKDDDLADIYDSLVSDGSFPEDGYCNIT